MATSKSSVGWLDISPAALRKLQAELEMRDKGVLDEMGVGSIHKGYADLLFPSTSVLHTRARYLLFVPWIYLWLAAKRTTVENVRLQKQKAELWLTERLRQREKRSGIIGDRTFPNPSAQPPDFAYWSALRMLRVYDGVSRAHLLAKWDRKRVVRHDKIPIGDDDLEMEPLAYFDVPPIPSWWQEPNAEVTFDLTEDEAAFLRDRLSTIEPPSLLGEAAGRLLAHSRPAAKHVWDDVFLREAAEALDRKMRGAARPLASVSDALDRTRGASALAELVRATYAAMVEMFHERDLRESGRLPLPEHGTYWRKNLEGYWETEPQLVDDACTLSMKDLAGDLALSEGLCTLLERVQEEVRAVRMKSKVLARLCGGEMCELFTWFERRRKGARARLAVRARREGFGPESLRVFGLHYRWPVVRRLLIDIQRGLFHGQA